MSNFKSSWKTSSLLGSAALAALAAGMLADITAARADDNPVETVVVTGTRFNTDAAPAKASLDTKEPQTIINKSYIENFIPPQSDYVTLLSIAPALTGTDVNGPGLSDGNVKNTLRGLPDGMFALDYDDIPFGDTNGPTHHNIAYFPATTIGSAVIDRGPGNAGNLGSATYGGTIKLFSEAMVDDPEAKAIVSYGSFNTQLEDLNGQTGGFDVLGTTAKVLVNLSNMQTNGALSGQDVYDKNALLKIEDQLNPHWKITLFGNYEHLYENLDDNNGATPAQIAVYGKNFALQNTNPELPTYAPYNYTTKATDMDYFRVNGEITSSLRLENTTYTYSYWNHTFSPNNETQDLAEIQSAEAGTCAPATPCFTSPGTKVPSGPDAGSYPNDVLAYNKENYYRVYGNITRLTQDYDFGWISGEVRAGLWWETQATHRFKYYYDADLCASENVNPFSGPISATDCGAQKGSSPVPGLGYAKDDEYSDWTQYEPFLEVDIKPTDDLTLTPGIKYIHWDRGVNAPVEQGNTCGIDKACPPNNALGQDYTAGFITREVLPFFEANYKIEPSWSVYFQYAKGVYVPDISSFEGSSPTNPNGFPAPENTTNYQLGTVYYADQFTFDADVYYIPISNNEETVACSYDPSDQCIENTGSAVYKGIEGEGTYAFDDLFGADVRGLSVFANGAIMSSKSQGFWVEDAPDYTAAAGAMYMNSSWKFALIEKLVGRSYAEGYNVPGAGSNSPVSNDPHYIQPAYGNLTGTVGYQIGFAELDLNADNLLNSRKTTAIVINDSTYQANRMDSLDQYFFQSPRSFMLTLKLHY